MMHFPYAANPRQTLFLQENLVTSDDRFDHHLNLVDSATFAANLQFLLPEMRAESAPSQP